MKIIQKIAFVFIMIIAIIIKLTCSSIALTGKVTADRLRVRAAATTESEILTRALFGEELEIINQDGDWYQVKFKGLEGYVSKNYVELLEENPPEENPKETQKPEEPEETQKPEEPKKPEEKKEEDNKVVTELGDTINQDIEGYIIPNYTALKVIDLNKNTKVKIITTLANWAKIQKGDVQAWVPKTILMKETKSKEPEEKPEETINKTAYISIDQSVNLREGPSKDTNSIAKLSKYEKVTLLTEENDWYKVKYNDKEGYILASLLTIGEPPDVSSRYESKSRNTGVTCDNLSYGYLDT